MHGYLSTDFTCSTVFQGQSSRKTVSFEEQIISKNKFACMFFSLLCSKSFKYFSMGMKNVYEQLTACCIGSFCLSVFWCEFITKQIFHFFCNKQKILSSHELNFKHLILIVSSGCKVWKWGKFRPIIHRQKQNVFDQS